MKDIEKYYSNISLVPCPVGSKNQRDALWNYKRYKVSDIQPGDNISMHTGTEAYPDWFTSVLDLDYNVQRYWALLRPIVSEIFGDTVIVQSGGQHHGLHVHYLTDRPLKSQTTSTQYGMTELKGIGDDGSPDIITLPPSIVLNTYRVIHPYKGNYINFSKVRRITTSRLSKKYHLFINKVNTI